MGSNDQWSITKNFDLGRLDIGYYWVIVIWLLVIKKIRYLKSEVWYLNGFK